MVSSKGVENSQLMPSRAQFSIGLMFIDETTDISSDDRDTENGVSQGRAQRSSQQFPRRADIGNEMEGELADTKHVSSTQDEGEISVFLFLQIVVSVDRLVISIERSDVVFFDIAVMDGVQFDKRQIVQVFTTRVKR